MDVYYFQYKNFVLKENKKGPFYINKNFVYETLRN